MEGPSLKIAAEELQPFKGNSIRTVEGNSKSDIQQFSGKKVKDIFSWGKHLVFQFDTVAFRIHFMMFGSYRAHIEGKETEGDYYKPKDAIPRLGLTFDNGTFKAYSCALKIHENTSDLKSTYDFTIDVLSPTYDKQKAFETVKKLPNEEISDVLLDQDIFAGVGNIIRNEVLWLEKVLPQTKISTLSDKQLKKIIDRQISFSFQFYEWKKIYQLKKHLQVYKKKDCPICGTHIIKENTGKRQRKSHYCPVCQK